MHPPFVGQSVLFVASDSVQDLATLSIDLGSKMPRSVRSITLRYSELRDLAQPSPYTVELYSLPHWIKSEATTIWGKNIQEAVILPRHVDRYLSCHLESIVHYSRNHLILRNLSEKRYQLCATHLMHQRALLMCTALLRMGIWRVYPSTVTTQFVVAYSDHRLRENVRETEGLRIQTKTQASQEAIYRLIWLYEEMVALLWGYV